MAALGACHSRRLLRPGQSCSLVARPDGRRPMTAANDILRAADAEVCRPWLRHILSHAGWTALAAASTAESWPLLAHWADTVQAHALFLDPETLTIVPVSTPVEAGSYPALSPTLPGAAWYERMIHDLWGHTAE